MLLRTVAGCCGIVALGVLPVFAGKNAPLEPAQASAGKQIIAETFDGRQLPEKWTAAKGDWQVRDGELIGKEKASDKHAAVLTCNVPNQDSAIRFSFKLDGADGVQLSYNHAKGHLFRVIVSENGIVLRTDKDKKDPNSQSVALAQAKTKFKQGEWVTMLVEVHGPTVTVKTDNGVALSASHPSIATAKPNYRFVMRGESVAIDDVTVWQWKKAAGRETD